MIIGILCTEIKWTGKFLNKERSKMTDSNEYVWYPVVINRLNNLTEILYECPFSSEREALKFQATANFSHAIDTIKGLKVKHLEEKQTAAN